MSFWPVVSFPGLHQHVLVVASYVLAFLRGPPKPLETVVTAVGVLLGVDGDDVTFEPRGVRAVVLAILALIHLPATVSLHVLLQLHWLSETTPAALTLEGEVLCVH